MNKQIFCPVCGGQDFTFGIIDSKVSLLYDTEKDEFSVQESENNFHTVQCKCYTCNNQFDVHNPEQKQRLINPEKKCKECGRSFRESDLDENGVCDVCRLIKIDPGFADIANQGDFTMVRMIAKLSLENHKLSDQNVKLQEQLKKAEEVKKKISNAGTEEEKPKRGRGKKKEEKTVADVIDIDSESETVQNDIEISEDIAPELPPIVSEISNEISNVEN